MLHAADVEARLSQRAAATADKVVVAVRAEKVVSKTALAWALTHVVQPGDGIVFLAVFSSKRTGSTGNYCREIYKRNWAAIFCSERRISLFSLSAIVFGAWWRVVLAPFLFWVVEGRKLWKFSRLSGDSRDGDRQEMVDRISRISESCSQMVLEFHDQVQVHFVLV